MLYYLILALLVVLVQHNYTFIPSLIMKHCILLDYAISVAIRDLPIFLSCQGNGHQTIAALFKSTCPKNVWKLTSRNTS